MDDKYLMDTHKLHWHLNRVNDWLSGKRVAPIYIDVGLSKGCNIKCNYCFGILQGNLYKKGKEVYFPRKPLLRYVKEAGEVGVKSMAFIGEGEPLMNPHAYEVIVEAKRAGVDVALGTNGILLDTGKDGQEALGCLSWIRFNISASSEGAYQKIHGSGDFSIALEKIKFCVKLKKARKLKIAVGLQMVLTPNNVDQAISLARLGKKMGADYLVIKQCSDTVKSELGIFNNLKKYDYFCHILKEAEEIGSQDYSVIIKWDKITNKGRRNYEQCLGVPFLLYSSGDGKLYPCGMFFNYKKEEYLMGDLTRESFKKILESKRYRDIVDKIKRINVNECYSNCRTHAINEFLWDVVHPPEHVNFI